jgi:Spy/CpxP family protein refolding chaperone
MVERLKKIIAKQLPTDYLCRRMKKNVEDAREERLQKWLKQLEGLTPEQTELKIKEWEAKSESV